MLWIFFFAIPNFISVICLDNGLAITPPMGWLSWERFKCNIDCDKDPSNCLSEKLFMEMAEKLISDGYKDAGYTYINIDDCWMSPTRDKNGDMVADPKRFPRGIRFLADFMHERGLKLGMYQDFGTHTCMGFPGLVGHMMQDAKKFIEWDIDMLKVDGCYSKVKSLDWGYTAMGRYLKFSKKPILYSCSWPYYKIIRNIEPNYKLISSVCNIWRNFHDIHDAWDYIEDTMDFFADNQEVITKFTGPGRWSDPDMLMIGNTDLTMGQSRIQMAVWSIIPGPLLMSNDLRSVKDNAKEILLNKQVIAVNQDTLGFPGKRIYKKKLLEVWRRKISPSFDSETSFALLFINRNEAKKSVIKTRLTELGLSNITRYTVTELFKNRLLGVSIGNETMRVVVPPMDAVMMRFNIDTIIK